MLSIKCNLPFVAILILTINIGCGSKLITPEGELDTPEYNYQIGKKFLDAGELSKAMTAFQRAKGLKKGFAPAYEGIGLVYLARGEFKEAMKMMDESQKKDKNYVPAYIGKARVFLGMDKIKDAITVLREALRIEKENPDAYFYMGVAFMKDYQFQKAEKWFAKTLEISPAYKRADTEWKRANQIQRAMPGTKVGKKIALVEKITRADLAALFAEELRINRYFKTPPVLKHQAETELDALYAKDIKGHWAEGYINTMLNLGVMEAHKNGQFLPTAPVKRADFAWFVQNILLKVQRLDDLATRFVDSSSPFSDVSKGAYYFNAVMLVTTRGILNADFESGNFHPNATVSGAEALLALRKLREVMEN